VSRVLFVSLDLSLIHRFVPSLPYFLRIVERDADDTGRLSNS
jgi:hypothetical protein